MKYLIRLKESRAVRPVVSARRLGRVIRRRSRGCGSRPDSGRPHDGRGCGEPHGSGRQTRPEQPRPNHRRLTRQDALPVRARQARQEHLLRHLCKLLASAHHTRQATCELRCPKRARRDDPSQGRQAAGQLPRPSPLPLLRGRGRGPDHRRRAQRLRRPLVRGLGGRFRCEEGNELGSECTPGSATGSSRSRAPMQATGSPSA